MQYKKAMLCLYCERTFSVFVSHEPEIDELIGALESPLGFAWDLEIQLGVEEEGAVYAECPYDDCEGVILDFRWWDDYRKEHSNAPAEPAEQVVYPIYS